MEFQYERKSLDKDFKLFHASSFPRIYADKSRGFTQSLSLQDAEPNLRKSAPSNPRASAGNFAPTLHVRERSSCFTTELLDGIAQHNPPYFKLELNTLAVLFQTVMSVI